MILTAQEEFGLRCALTLARATDQGTVSLTLGQIAAAEGLTVPYAGKIMRMLVAAGLVESTRGRSGGYVLARDPRAITVAEVLAGLGGKIYHEEMCESGPAEESPCIHNRDCSLRSVWSGLQSMIDLVLSRTSLQDLARDEAAMDRVVMRLRHQLDRELTSAESN